MPSTVGDIRTGRKILFESFFAWIATNFCILAIPPVAGRTARTLEVGPFSQNFSFSKIWSIVRISVVLLLLDRSGPTGYKWRPFAGEVQARQV
jgi:hypothetical protein